MYDSFKTIDKNGDGKISKPELIEFYGKMYPHMNDEQIIEEIDTLFKQVD